MREVEENWLPVRAALHPDGLYLALRQVRAEDLRDAFMQETIARIPAAEKIVRIATGDIGRAATGSAPAGLVFHVARCGSTLISQLLKQHGGLVVYAEPLPVNEILVPPHKRSRALLVGALRSLADAFARHAGKPYVLKCSSWNTLFCDIVAEAFPDSPWTLSLRDPVEVGVSLLGEPPGWLRDRSGPTGPFAAMIDPDGASASPEEYVARLYGAFCDAAVRLDARHGRLVPYETLPAAAWEVVAPHFGLAVDRPQRERMAAAARIDAKAPVGKASDFVRDAAKKQADASAALRQAIDAFARPPLARLERTHMPRAGAGVER
jgi:hypothetical protein